MDRIQPAGPYRSDGSSGDTIPNSEKLSMVSPELSVDRSTYQNNYECPLLLHPIPRPELPGVNGTTGLSATPGGTPRAGSGPVSRDMRIDRVNPDTRFDRVCSKDLYRRLVTFKFMTLSGLS